MSKIDALIQQYCPNGVEYKTLGEICNFKRGTSITKAQTKIGNIPVIAGGQIPAYYHDQANRTGETITVSDSGAYAGFIAFWTIPIFVSDAFTVEPKSDLLTKYVFYFLTSIQDRIYETKERRRSSSRPWFKHSAFLHPDSADGGAGGNCPDFGQFHGAYSSQKTV